MTASVEIITQVKDDILLIPIASVTTRNEKDSIGEDIIKQIIFVQDDEKAKVVEIKTGISDFENIEVLSGLTEGDRIVSGPYIAISKQLKEGTKISEKEKSKKEEERSKSEKQGGVTVEIN